MFYNGILMETIGISVMVSIGLLLFFLAGKYLNIRVRYVYIQNSGILWLFIWYFKEYLNITYVQLW